MVMLLLLLFLLFPDGFLLCDHGLDFFRSVYVRIQSINESKITFSRLVFNPACGQLNREKMNFPSPRSRLIIWSRETDSAVPSRVSPLILHAQAEFGAYSRAPLFPPAFHHRVVSAPEKRHRVSLTQKLRSNGVTTESPPAQDH